MSVLKRTLGACAATGLALAAFATPASADGVDSAMNHPGYWGDDCTKVEYADGLHVAAVPAGGDFLIVKTGRSYTRVDYGSMYFDKDISFIITCWGAPQS